MAKTPFYKLMDSNFGRAKNLSCLIYLYSVEKAICTNVFHTKYLQRKHYKIFICYFHKFSVHDHLHEHYCPYEQLVAKTLIEIESAVAKQAKH